MMLGTRPLAVKGNTRAPQQREERVVYNNSNIHLLLNFSKKENEKELSGMKLPQFFSVFINAFS